MKNSRHIFHPATMYFLIMAAVVFLSWIFNVYGMSAVHPQTLEVINVQSLLSPEGIRWMLRNVITNFTGFAPLGLVIVAMFGIGVAEHSGFVVACIRRRAKHHRQSQARMILWVIALGIVSNVISGAGYILLLPIAATLFQSVGLHPVGGIITAYVSVALSQDASVATDVVRNGVGPLSNYYFMLASLFLIAGVIYFITRRQLLPALGVYDGDIRMDDYKPLSRRERRALTLSLTIGAIYLLLILWATFSSWGLLRSVNGGLVRSPFIAGILFLLSLGVGLMGSIYGFASGRYRTDTDVVEGLVRPAKILGIYLVIVFFAAQMFACLEYSRLDKCLAIFFADRISILQVSGMWALLLFILFSALVNLVMVSTTAKWAIMGFIFVPAFAAMGISPDVTQCAFRIGDGSTNAITPFLFYAPLVLAYMQHYDRHATYLSLLRCTWRYSAGILVLWSLFFVVWLLLGLPLGL